jgi:hypothetical protein
MDGFWKLHPVFIVGDSVTVVVDKDFRVRIRVKFQNWVTSRLMTSRGNS